MQVITNCLFLASLHPAVTQIQYESREASQATI